MSLEEGVTICKKCIAPKPARTHHCSVCNRCVLKMDHHCRMFVVYISHFEILKKYIYIFSMAQQLCWIWQSPVFLFVYGVHHRWLLLFSCIWIGYIF